MIYAELDDEFPGKIVIRDFEWRYKESLSNIPGSSFRKDKYLLPLEWATALAMQANLGQNLKTSKELYEWMADYYNTRILPAYNIRGLPSIEEGYEFLYPHQKADVKFLSTARRALLANDLGSGKAQPISEPILTPNGWVRMGDINVGDEVIGSSGKSVKVLGTFPQGVRDVYKVTMKDGSFTYADADHLWDVKSQKDESYGRHRILTTKDLMDYGVSKKNLTYTTHKFRVPTVEPVEFEKNSLPVPPYTLGALLGDGGITNSVLFTTEDDEIIDRVHDEVSDIVAVKVSVENIGGGSATTYRLSRKESSGSNPLTRSLRDLDLMGRKSDTKFIPEMYKFSSVQDRIDLLRGLMDTDGTVGAITKSGAVGAVAFCTVSTALAYDVKELVLSLGGLVTWSYHKRPKGGNYDPIVLTIKMPPEINPFFLKRKADKVIPHKKYQIARYISNIEFSHREESQCIAVDSPDRLYITRDYIVTHNTYSSSATLRHMDEEGEEVLPILIVCPNSTKLGWAKEFEKVWPGRKITVIEGTATQRRKQFKEFQENDGEVLIMNWELVRQHSRLNAYGGIALKRCPDCGGLDPKVKATACEAHQKELNEIDFKAVIGDEIHRISDPSSKVSRAFKNASGEADVRIALSGTPINATPDQLFSALNWLYPEAYPSKVKFLDRFCDMVPGEWGGNVVLGVKKHMEGEFFAGLDPILRRMPKSVILPFLPPVMRVRRDVEMSPKQAKAYKQMAEKMMAEVGENDVTTTTSPLVQLLRMLQFASAYVEVSHTQVLDTNSPFPNTYIDKEVLTMSDPSSKLDAFMDDIEDFGESSVVVFAHHKQLIDLLAARMDKKGIHYGLITGDQDVVERQAYMEAFQDGRIKFILCTIQAGGTGITLTKADTMVFLQRSYSMIDNLQAEGRAHRIGSEQHDQITIIDYVSTGTADESVLEAIEKKQENLEFILRDNQVIEDFLAGKFDFNEENEDK